MGHPYQNHISIEQLRDRNEATKAAAQKQPEEQPKPAPKQG